MQVLDGAGRFTPGSPNHWVEHLSVPDLSVGTYSIPVSGEDDQTPHTEDEIYIVQSGRGRLVTDSGSVDLSPGNVIYVPARERHQFVDVTEDLALLVVFAPAYESRG
jgi:mannose-6-phosphate isomerase-like protein (cupin superfamily)